MFGSVVNRPLVHCLKSVPIQMFSGPYFAVFSPNTGKYGPQKTPYLDTFHTVVIVEDLSKNVECLCL